MTDMCAAALKLAQQGWRVFQVHSIQADGSCTCNDPACDRPGKHPVPDTAPHGPLSATTDPDIIRAAWARHPTANIGGATGSLSGMVVLDIDEAKGGYDTLAAWELAHGPLPETPVSLTGGGGKHFVFSHPGVAVTNRVKFLGDEATGYVPGQETGVDFRGDGGYVVLPPSLHASGRRYAWELSSLPDELPLAPVPLPLLSEVISHASPPGAKGGKGEPVASGGRNDFLHKTGCTLRGLGMSPNQIFDSLMDINQERCSPPLAESEVRRTAESAARYTPNPFYGGTPLKPLSELAKIMRPTQFDPVELNDLMKEDRPQHEFLVEPYLILGGTSLWVAKPGVGKSTTIRTLIRAVAGGSDHFLGGKVHHGGVYYFALEERRDQVAKHFEDMRSSDLEFAVWTSFGEAPERALDRAFEQLQRYRPALVVFDPLISITRIADPNNYASVALAMGEIQAMARHLELHIACIHHAGKGVKDDIDTGVGSIAFPGTVDTHLILGKKAGDVRVIKSAKVRYGRDLPETVLLLDAHREVVDGGTLEERILERLRVQILESLGEEELTEPEVNQRLGDSNRGGVNKALNSLVQTGELVFRGNGRKGSPRLYSKPVDLRGSAWETLEIPSLWTVGEPLPAEGLGF